MAQFNGVMPDGIDLSQFEGIPEYLINKQSRLSDHNPVRDKDLMVKFFHDSYFESAKTKELGVPVFSTRVFIQVILPDNRTRFVQMINFEPNGKPSPDTAKWLTRFPRQWEAFQAGVVQGYPLSQLPHADKGLVATLEMVGVKTAEAFVELSGEIMERIPELKDLQEQAKKFLASKDVLTVHVEKNKQLEAELAELKQQLQPKRKAKNVDSSPNTH
jgi:hypothetical protein